MKPGIILLMAFLAPSLFCLAQDKAPAARDAANPPAHNIKVGVEKNETFGFSISLKGKKSGGDMPDSMGIMQY